MLAAYFLIASKTLVSPAFIDVDIFRRLSLKSCSECDKLRTDFPHWTLSKKRLFREEMNDACKCNSNKYDCLISISYLLDNGCYAYEESKIRQSPHTIKDKMVLRMRHLLRYRAKNILVAIMKNEPHCLIRHVCTKLGIFIVIGILSSKTKLLTATKFNIVAQNCLFALSG